MKNGFIKVAAATPAVQVANTTFNTTQIIDTMHQAQKEEVRLLVFPELSISSYTCGDLFLQDTLLDSCLSGLGDILRASAGLDMVIVVGLPFLHCGCLYNVAAVLFDGQLLGMIPKQNIPNYSEFYEARHFASAPAENEVITIPSLGKYGKAVSFGPKLLFAATNLTSFVLGIDICEDLWMPIPPSCHHAMASATVIANLSASDETTGKDLYRRELVRNQSARLICGYIYADAGDGESSTDLVFAGHNLIAENGMLLTETERFCNGMAVSELDLGRLIGERRRMATLNISSPDQAGYEVKYFSFHQTGETKLTRSYSRTPFVPDDKNDRDRRCKEILNIQATGLKKRLAHTHCKNAVIGISGGLDSTLALLVTVKAFDMLGLDHSGIRAITMPCFGTTDRTKGNARQLTEQLGASLQEIPIHEAVELHFRDIGHSQSVHDVTYENSQARQRTMLLMDIANQNNGMVIGTGDLSELALGWATYNGDHMSMYGVNASIPKTLVRYLVLYYAQTSPDEKLRHILMDILDTPVSPELLPPKDGKISQRTEELVGPYELHDFYLYYMMRFGFSPSKIYRLACYTFEEAYSPDTIAHWLRIFYQRFFAQQFKRSCLPDGPKVGSVALSPRGDWRMPSDASVEMWLKDLENITPHKQK